MLTRRRFLAISAVMALPAAARAAPPLHIATGQALGAQVTLRLAHPEAPAIAARAMAEIARLEDVFSLYRPSSALMRLNVSGVLEAPPFDLLECLTLAGQVHAASGGRFDPTVQPLWSLQAETASRGRAPDAAELADARARTGWHRLRIEAGEIRLDPGMALTLNGIAQGYIADRVTDLLRAEGLGDILIDTGEMRALGGDPRGGDWPVRLQDGGTVSLRDRALATSGTLGTTFDAAGMRGHILDPVTGNPARPVWRAVTIAAPSAALADALSTAACLMQDRADITALCDRFAETAALSLVPL